ncbi:MAG: hypothetical protein ACXWBN_17555 [Acidimicrobiales bacterium]
MPEREREPEPVAVDLADFDAVGIVSEILVSVRAHSLATSADTAATVSAPDGWHRAVMTARDSGHVVLGVRYDRLSTSRLKNVADALARRGWQLDDDGEGATIRFPPGTDATTPAFELLAALTVWGAPSDVRSVTATDRTGAPVDLHPPEHA